MLNVRVDDARVIAALAQAATHTANTAPLMREIAGIMKQEVEDNFEAGGRPAWAPLSPRTIEQRRKEGTWPGQILNRSGASGLLGSITESATETTAVVGTNKVYGAIQHFGGEIQRTAKAGKKRKKGSYTIKLPARPYLMLSAEGIQEILDAIGRFLGRK